MKEILLPVLLGCLGSTALFTFLQFLISRRDNKKDKKDELRKELKEIKQELSEIKSLCNIHEKDICRSQLLLLIADYPEDKTEIMKLAEHYFADLKANWYMSSIFNTWLENNDTTKPDWFKA